MIRDYFENQRRLRPSSVNAYMICLKKLNNGAEPSTLDFLNNFDDIFEKLKPMKLTTQRSYMIAVNQALKSVAGMDEIKDVYELKLEDLDFDYNQLIDAYQKSETEEQNWTSLAELKVVADYWVDMIDEIQYSTKQFLKVYEIYKNAIVALLYTEHPSIRLEYATMEVVHNADDIDPNKNYLLIEPNEMNFVLQKYKTSAKHHEKVWRASPRLSELITNWMKINHSKYLLPNRAFTNHITTNALGKLITRVFEPVGKKVTLNIIRHIWITENVDPSILDANAELADAMCHTPMTQRNYIRA